jgi:hypothetical protein
MRHSRLVSLNKVFEIVFFLSIGVAILLLGNVNWGVGCSFIVATKIKKLISKIIMM